MRFIIRYYSLGNTCVLYVFYKTPRLRTVTSYYIITLAISDISMAFFIMTTTIGAASYGRDVIGKFIGQITAVVGYTLVFGSLQTTSLIALNRFYCVVKNTLYKKYFNPKFAVMMIVMVWIIAVLNTTLFWATGLATMEFFPGRFVYLLAFKDMTINKIFAIVSVVLFSCMPMSLTVVCYHKIYKAVQGHNTTVSTTINTLSKDEIGITKSVLALVCGFVLCWIPCSIIVLVSIYWDLSRQGEMVFTYTAYLSSAVNPIIFNVFNKPFRRHMKLAFCPGSIYPAENTSQMTRAHPSNFIPSAN